MADESKLSIVIDAENKAGKAMKEVSSGLDGMKKKLEAMKPVFQKMAIVGTVAFGAIVGVIGTSIKAAADSQKQWALTSKQIELSGLVVDETLKETQRFSSEMQKLTGCSDEYVGMLVGRFLPSVKNLEEAKKMARMALDMEASGMVSAEVATKALMAAHEGDIEMLKRYVPEMRGLDSEMLKSTSTTEKYQFAIELLEKQFGGLAETTGKTLTGQLNVLKETFGDLQEKIGEQFIPILMGIVDKVKPIIEKMMEWVEAHPKLTAVLLIVGAALSGLVAVIGVIGLVLPGLIVMFGAITLPILAVVAGIVALIAIGVILVMKWTEIKEFFQQTWEGIKIIFTEAIDSIKNFLEKLFSPFIALVKYFQSVIKEGDFFNDWLTHLPEPIRGVIEAFGKIITIIQDFARYIRFAITEGDFLNDWLTHLPEPIQNAVKFIVYFVEEIKRNFTEIGYFLMGVVLIWVSFLRPIWQPIVDATTIIFFWLKTEIEKLSDFVYIVWNRIRETTMFIWNSIMTYFLDTWNGIKIIFSEAVIASSDFVYGVFIKLKEALSLIWEGISNVIRTVWEGIKTFFLDTWEGIKTIFGNAIDWLMAKIQPFLDIFEKVKSAGATVAQGISGFIGRGVGALRNIGKTGIMPEFQQGGIVPGAFGAPIPAIVHGGERIIPAGKSFGNIYLTITGNTFMSNEETAEKIGDMIMNVLKRQTRFAV